MAAAIRERPNEIDEGAYQECGEDCLRCWAPIAALR